MDPEQTTPAFAAPRSRARHRVGVALLALATTLLVGCGSSSGPKGYYNMTTLAKAVQGKVNPAYLGEWTVSVQCVLTRTHEATCDATPNPGSGPLAATAQSSTFTEVISPNGASYFDANN